MRRGSPQARRLAAQKGLLGSPAPLTVFNTGSLFDLYQTLRLELNPS